MSSPLGGNPRGHVLKGRVEVRGKGGHLCTGEGEKRGKGVRPSGHEKFLRADTPLARERDYAAQPPVGLALSCNPMRVVLREGRFDACACTTCCVAGACVQARV